MAIPHWVPKVEPGFDITSNAITVYRTCICWARASLRGGQVDMMSCHPRSRSAPRNTITDSCPSSGFVFATNHANYLTSDTRQIYGQLCPKILAPANYVL